jgi:hypothetical protein
MVLVSSKGTWLGGCDGSAGGDAAAISFLESRRFELRMVRYLGL